MTGARVRVTLRVMNKVVPWWLSGLIGALVVPGEVRAEGVAVGPAAVGATRPAPPPEGLRKRRGYVALAPGIVAVPVWSSPAGYIWGIEGGYHLPAGKRFAAQVAGFFEHAVMWWHRDANLYRPAQRGTEHQLRLGPQLRIGAGGRKVFGYGLVRLGADIVYGVSRGESGTSRTYTGTLFMTSLGAGVQGLVANRVLLGGETGADASFAAGSGDEPEVLILLRARFYVGFMF